MRQLKLLGLAATAALALTAMFGAAGAWATTLEETGVTKNSSVTLTLSLKSGTSSITRDTAAFSQNTCTTSNVHGSTTVFTGASVTGPLTGHTAKEKEEGKLPSSGMSFSGCTRPVTVHDPGTLEITYTSGTNGTVASEETLVTIGSAFGILTCDTGATTKIGTLTGVAGGSATMDVNAVLNCGIFPSAKWEATYVVTSPDGLGVSP
jgi:hypothetical protein